MTGRVGVSRRVTLTVGHVTHDRFGNRNRAGGSAFYGARTMHALGARSRLVSTVGADFERHHELSGLELLLNVSGSTMTFENAYAAGRARVQRVSAVGGPVTPRSLPAEWRKADVLFLAPVFGEVDVAAWFDAVDAPLVGLGLQGFLKGLGSSNGTGHSVVPRPLEVARELLDRVDVVFLSDEDVVELTSGDFLSRLRSVVPIVALTEGARGSRVWTKTGEHRIGTFPAVVSDPTGAGDVFAAAFLFALSDGARPGEAAVLASAAASIVIEEEGGGALDRLADCHARAAAVPVQSAL